MPIKHTTAAQVVEYLNELLKLDQTAMQNLLSNRVMCGRAIGEHPTVQVRQLSEANVVYDVGPLGVINGMFGVYDDGIHKGWGPIVAIYDENSKLLTGFRLAEEEALHDNDGTAD